MWTCGTADDLEARHHGGAHDNWPSNSAHGPIAVHGRAGQPSRVESTLSVFAEPWFPRTEAACQSNVVSSARRVVSFLKKETTSSVYIFVMEGDHHHVIDWGKQILEQFWNKWIRFFFEYSHYLSTDKLSATRTRVQSGRRLITCSSRWSHSHPKAGMQLSHQLPCYILYA